jgi:hypothetical protein
LKNFLISVFITKQFTKDFQISRTAQRIRTLATMYYINNNEMICIPFSMETVNTMTNTITANALVVLGVIASSIALFGATMVSYLGFLAQSIYSNVTIDQFLLVAVASSMFMLVLILTDTSLIITDIHKKVNLLSKENDIKTAKIEMLTSQMDQYWEKMSKTA